MPHNVHDSILGTIGNTPLVRLNRITRQVAATVYAKVETFNPGHSIKDRMAVKMIVDAERRGLLKPGGMVTTWAPTDRVRATFLSAFPHAIEMANGQILIGSRWPIAVEPAVWKERIFAPGTVSHLGRPRASGVWVEVREASPASREPVRDAQLNRDLFPRDEFNTP